jgi:hypothetical protein
MRGPIRSIRSTSPATVLAGLALFGSLGGVSYAVATGSIDSREIKNGGVRSVDIRDGSVRSRDVRDGGLQGRDLRNGSVQSRDVRDGALRGVDVNDRSLGGIDLAMDTLGAREIDESQLRINRLAGIDASRYVRNVRRIETATANDAVSPKTAPSARCPVGKRLLGGGARVVSGAPVPVALSSSGPDGNGWAAAAYATAPTGTWQLVSVAICG